MKQYRKTVKYKQWLKQYSVEESTKAIAKQSHQKYRQQYPERMKAKDFLNGKIKSGKIQRPATCSQCGATTRVDGHHWKGYSKEHWLDVIWLCRACHKNIH